MSTNNHQRPRLNSGYFRTNHQQRARTNAPPTTPLEPPSTRRQSDDDGRNHQQPPHTHGNALTPRHPGHTALEPGRSRPDRLHPPTAVHGSSVCRQGRDFSPAPSSPPPTALPPSTARPSGGTRRKMAANTRAAHTTQRRPDGAHRRRPGRFLSGGRVSTAPWFCREQIHPYRQPCQPVRWVST